MAMLFKYFKKQSLPTSNEAELQNAAMTILELLENKQYQYHILGSSHLNINFPTYGIIAAQHTHHLWPIAGRLATWWYAKYTLRTGDAEKVGNDEDLPFASVHRQLIT